MNKQAFTFLTLFTLVMLLAVYYVTLPADTGVIEPDGLIVNTQTNPIEQYEEEKQQQNAEIRSQNEQVISSSTSTSEEKLEALNQNSKLDAAALFETNVQELLKENGFDSCFVEKNNDIVRVILPEEYNSQQSALMVMKLIGQLSDENFLVEVSFE